MKGRLQVQYSLSFIALSVAALAVVSGAFLYMRQAGATPARFVLVAAGVMLLGTAASILIGRWLARPISKLEKMAAETAAEKERVIALEQISVLKDDFVAKVSHEFRTPLTSIKEGVNLVRDNALGATTEEQQDFLSTIDQDIDRLTELVNNLLDLSKAEAGRLDLRCRRVDIRQTLDATLASHRALLGRRTLSREYGEVPPVFVEANRMHQVFQNLLSNAVKFTDDDGAITVRVARQGEEVTVTVRDNGAGIAPRDLPKLFQKFSQVGSEQVIRSRGTGLGLVVCKELVELHGGRIEVESELGRGTSFTVRLPVYTDGWALADSFQRIQKRAGDDGVPGVGLIAIQMENHQRDDGGADDREQLQQLSDRIRRTLDRRDIVLDLDQAWVVAFVAADAGAVQTILTRLHGAFGAAQPMRVGAAFYPDDGHDLAGLFRRATGTPGQVPPRQSRPNVFTPSEFQQFS